MRPTRLELEGFGAFRHRTEIDFADVDLFALVGPTGAGKSTVIDAICFALYGSVPRYGDERQTSPAISVGAHEARVRLTFEVGGQGYVAARVVRRAASGKATTVEARLQRLADGVELAGSARDLVAQVTGLLGLSFDHFTRTVVLPQGEFARFLHDKPADRQRLLTELLDLHVYATVGQRANQRAAAARALADGAEARLAGLIGTSDAALAEAIRRRDTMEKVAADVEAGRAELEALDERRQSAADEAARTKSLLEALAAVGVPSDARAYATDLGTSQQAVHAATRAHAVADAVLRDASARLADAPDLTQVELLLSRHAEADDLRVGLTDAATTAADAARAAEQATAQLGIARAGADQARTELDRVRALRAAHALHEQLVAGEPCPVCQQTVLVVAPLAAPADLERARAAVGEAEQAERRAAEQATVADRALTAAQTEHTALRHRVDEVLRALDGAPDPAVLEGRRAEARAARAGEAQAREAEDAARRAMATRQHQHDELVASGDRHEATFHAQRDRVASLSPPAPAGDLLDRWSALEAWAAERQPAVGASHQLATEAEQAAAAGRAALLARLATTLAGAGAAEVPARPDRLDQLTTIAVRSLADLEHRVGQIEQARAEAAQLRSEADAARAEQAVAHQLGQLLDAKRFPRWLVTEAFHALTLGASETLRQMSAGQYSLVLDDDAADFSVIDHANGDERRGIRTLSGGETFQASLALALALAEHLAELAGSAGKLDAIFLDEGFGSLDPESLDTVAASIESLGATGRMVGLVTHVSELAERVPVRYRVRKEQGTATVTREVGG